MPRHPFRSRQGGGPSRSRTTGAPPLRRRRRPLRLVRAPRPAAWARLLVIAGLFAGLGGRVPGGTDLAAAPIAAIPADAADPANPANGATTANAADPASGGELYRDPAAPAEARARDLVSRMTLEEKFWQLFMLAGEFTGDPARFRDGLCGLQVPGEPDAEGPTARLNAIQRHFVEETRLGIPVLFFAEALHGLVQRDATIFPQAIGLAATFDTSLVASVAGAIAAECRARGVRQVLSPVVNVATDVRWGRVEETYGEDPFLAAGMGAAFVGACERAGVIATPKHWIANVGDGGRDSYPFEGGERLLRELHLPPFAACLQRGGARSIMTSYNSVGGTPCSAHPWLNGRLLKQELGFTGFVISDAGAVGGLRDLHGTAVDYAGAAEAAVEAGLDVIFQTSFDHHLLFGPPFREGRVDPARLDDAVARVLRGKIELGLFDDPYVRPEAFPAPGSAPHRELARRSARASIVLLKNAAGVLPFSPALRSLAVLGPEATEARCGGYSAPAARSVSILDGIRERLGPSAVVRHAPGCRRAAERLPTLPAEALTCAPERGAAVEGLLGEYFDRAEPTGRPVFTRVDPGVDFQWTLFSPDPQRLPRDFYSVRWTGTLRSPVSGPVRIGVEGNDGWRLYLDDALLIDNRVPASSRTVTAEVPLEAGAAHSIRLEFSAPTGNARIRLVWDAEERGATPKGRWATAGTLPADDAMEEAVALAAACEAAVVTVGIEEGEFRDRASLALPGRQEELIRRVAALGKPLAVVLVGGSAVTMSRWLDAVPSVLAAWYPGEEGGRAVAEILFGDYSPAGRLPITFPIAEGQLPLVYNHKPSGRGDDYIDLSGQPLFPFGHGLAYTTFAYADLRIEPAGIGPGEAANARFTLRNTGTRDGEEVVQLYLRDELASVARPVAALAGFRRIHLRAGESQEVDLPIPPEALTLLDAELRPVIEPGEFRIMIGSSARDIRLRGNLRVLAPADAGGPR